MDRLNIVYIFGLIIFGYSVIAQTDTPNTENVSNSTDHLTRPYCYRFTWLGPKYNEESSYKNATCSDVLKGAKGVPCVHPLVVTNNSYVPDTNWIWDNYKMKPSDVACRLVRGEVCAKFLYRYNGEIENITYLCTKVNIETEGAVRSGCYVEYNNATGREIEACVCESRAGQYPCNSANPNFTQFNVIFMISIVSILYRLFI